MEPGKEQLGTQMMTPKQAKPHPDTLRFARGFMHFVRQYNVIPLAIAVVIGNSLNDVVKVVVEGMVTPFISLILPSTALQGYEITVRNSTFQIGAVVNAVLGFLVVALIVYVFAKKVLHDEKVLEKK
ncbi:MAG TPA: MscL family protein [Verrucomicrobiae bacterium]|nr:MscL family protein [Verrucomicrobiae bacterium]